MIVDMGVTGCGINFGLGNMLEPTDPEEMAKAQVMIGGRARVIEAERHHYSGRTQVFKIRILVEMCTFLLRQT